MFDAFILLESFIECTYYDISLLGRFFTIVQGLWAI